MVMEVKKRNRSDVLFSSLLSWARNYGIYYYVATSVYIIIYYNIFNEVMGIDHQGRLRG
jgi:hypothetical protein